MVNSPPDDSVEAVEEVFVTGRFVSAVSSVSEVFAEKEENRLRGEVGQGELREQPLGELVPLLSRNW